MNSNNQDVVAINPVDGAIKEIVSDIMQEQDPKKTKDLVDLFNWNISKKNVARIEKLNSLYDAITDQMTERVTKRADQFSNSDLLDYVKTIQSAIDTNTKNLSQVDDPPLILQQHNTQINVNVTEKFDRVSKERILAAVQATLAQVKNAPIEGSATEIIDTEE
jgi:DNA replication protein DnaD